MEEGSEFDVKWIALYSAFRDKVPWNRSLISSYPQVSSIMDKLLVYEPKERCAAATVLQDPWMLVSDPAISASAELLARGTLLYNLSTWAQGSQVVYARFEMYYIITYMKWHQHIMALISFGFVSLPSKLKT